MLAAIAFLLAIPQATPEPVVVRYLAVGNTHYQPSERAFPPVFGANWGAERVARLFDEGGAAGGTLLRSTSSQLVSRRDIFAALDAELGRLTSADRPRSLFVVYLAGHGMSEGIGWNHLSVPGAFAGDAKTPNVDELSKVLVYAGDLADRLDAAKVHYLVLLDSCYDGDPADLPPNVFSAQNIANLRDLFAPLKVVNEFRQPSPVVFSAEPGKQVATAPEPGDDKQSIGPLARRLILAVERHRRRAGPMTLGELTSSLVDPALDWATSPAVTHTTHESDGLIVLSGQRRPSIKRTELRGTAPPSPVAVATKESTTPAPLTPQRGTQLVLRPEPGESITEGVGHSYGETTLKRWTVEESASGLDVSYAGEGGGGWSLSIVAPDEKPLANATYARAQRAPFQDAGRPGFSFSGFGHGCNEVAANFTVAELKRRKDGGVERLVVRFDQRCDDIEARLHGELTLVLR